MLSLTTPYGRAEFAADGRHLEEGMSALGYIRGMEADGYKLSQSNDEGDVGRDGVSGANGTFRRCLPQPRSFK